MEIITNNQMRDILYWYDLTEKEQDEFNDYFDGIEESSFFRYKKEVYCLCDFMHIGNNSDLSEWDGIFGQSYSDAIIVKLPPGHDDSVIVGHVYS